MAGDKKGGSKLDGVVTLVIIGFVCLLSFSIGTFVGKKFSDSQHKVAQFEPNGEAAGEQERDVASIHPDSTEVKPGDALSDDEVAKLAEEFVTEEGKAEHGSEAAPKTDKNTETVREAKAEHGEAAEEHGGHKAESKSEHGKKPTRTTQSVEPMKAAHQVANDENPEKTEKQAPKPEHNRIPSSLPKQLADSPVGKYTVQVASFPSEKEAQKMASDLKAKKFSAFYVVAKIKDRKSNTEKTWYRVNVGTFATSKEADEYKKQLLAESKVASAMVQKISE